MNDVVTELLAELHELRRRQVTYRQGVVSTASPLAIKVGGSTVALTGVKRLASYTPVLNDVVAVLAFGNDVLVLGKVA